MATFAGISGIARPLPLLLLLAAGGPALAQDGGSWGPPSVDFSADMVFRDSRGQERKAQLTYTPDRQRLEYLAGRNPVALIVDKPAGKSWLLVLNRRQYFPLPHKPVDYFLGVSNPAAKRRVLGRESVLGRTVSKMEVTGETRTGDRFEGLAWVTEARIVVRLKGKVTRGDRTQAIEMEMTRLEVGPVDPALFDIPPNYEAVAPPKRP